MSIVRVVSAISLSSSSSKKIEAVFRKKHTEDVEFLYEIDPSLIGGILVIDGDNYFDATVRGQLAVLKRKLG